MNAATSTPLQVVLPYNIFFPFTSLTTLTLAISLYFVVVAFYRVFFSPLAALPGPWYAAVSDFWIITHVVRLRQCKTIQQLFDTYGPVVRIGPNKVAFCDVSSMRSVYFVHKFDKSNYYKSLLTNNNDHAMTTLPHAEHAIRKKAYSPHYNPSNLARFQPELHEFSLKLVDTLDRLAGKTSVGCLDLFRHLMVDVISCTVFGSKPGSLDKYNMNIQDPLSTAVYDFPKRGILRSVVPEWAWSWVCSIPNARFRQVCDSDHIMAEFVGNRLYELRANIQASKAVGDVDYEKLPLLQRMMEQRDHMSDQNIISEAMGHLVAGVDTTSTSLSYFLLELSRRPDIMAKLQAELDDAMPDRRVIPDISVLSRLPYLNAFIKEGLRLYGAAPSLLERVVPSRSSSSVSKDDEDFDLMGYALPPNTIVATQAWSMHRDPTVFLSPETFLPERWLAVDSSEMEEERLMRMAQQMMPFGAGARVCGGQNMAQMMLKIVVVAIARNFSISANALETNDTSMEIKDAFVIFPASMECKLSFHSRPQ
ncbi:cytochrome P450 [Abortiporus biennis]|nr:cytochrome P450 [Abortiporus biennis]